MEYKLLTTVVYISIRIYRNNKKKKRIPMLAANYVINKHNIL